MSRNALHQQTLQAALEGDVKAIARCISLIENDVAGFQDLLSEVIPSRIPVYGITGPPGAGKSTISDALIARFTDSGKKIAVLCVDPSSPFHQGAVLGDRVRMSRWYLHPSVFIRSFASRGSLGGLNPRIIEIIEFLKATGFDLILLETVGVGQSEVDIAALADLTMVVLVPEAGDEVQAMKSGMMEIADIFVVNKSDRPDAMLFTRNLRALLPHESDVKVYNTAAINDQGIDELYQAVLIAENSDPGRKATIYAEKAFQLIQERRMTDIDKGMLKAKIESELLLQGFNLHRFVKDYLPDLHQR